MEEKMVKITAIVITGKEAQAMTGLTIIGGVALVLGISYGAVKLYEKLSEKKEEK